MKISIVPTEHLRFAEIYALETLMDLGGLFYEHGVASDPLQPTLYYGHPGQAEDVRSRTIYIPPVKSERTLQDLDGIQDHCRWHRQGESLVIEKDIVRFAASLLTLEEERLSAARDCHDRFCGIHSRRSPESLRRPYLNALSLFLVRMVTLLAEMGGFVLPLRENPFHGKPFALAISHDVDAFDITRPEIHCFDKICEREEALGVSSSFYFCMTSGRGYHPEEGFWDPHYTIRDRGFPETLMALRDRGCEVGLHGSYDSGSYRDTNALLRERRLLERILKAQIYGGRQHYLRFRTPDTWRAYETSGLLYDSSLGYHDRIGFRAGIAAPFRPIDLARERPFDLWELPLIVMDGALFDMETDLDSPEKRWSAVETMLSRLEKENGSGAVLWHQRVFAHPAHPGWEEIYWEILHWVLDHGGFVGTLKDIVEAWRAASSVRLLSSSSINGNRVWRFRSPYDLKHLTLSFVGPKEGCAQISSDVPYQRVRLGNGKVSLSGLEAGEEFTISTALVELPNSPIPAV